jgi:tRNA A-37 threonylcarbamoyl transferase component Bud32
VLELVPGQIFASDFRVLRPLSKGGMGSVYVVEQVSTHLQRALKLMHPELVRDPRLRQRFEQEARIGGHIASDHIAQVISAGVDPASGTPWLAMELLQGETLAEWIQRRRATLGELFEIFGQLCHGLGAAHAQGIVHRDLKPENIFVALPRQAGLPFFIKVLDFGIAKMTSQHGAGATTTSMGTPLWMAPEQTENGHVGPFTDVWALGLIAFTLVTQRSYWTRASREDTTLPALMREILFEPLVPASVRAREYGLVLEAEQGFDAWFARAVSRDPAARFANASDAYGALTSWLPRPGVHAAAPPPIPTGYGSEPVPPTVGTGTHLPGAHYSASNAAYPAPDPRFPGVTERGISETVREAPAKGGRAVGLAAIVGVLGVLGGGAALFAWQKVGPAAPAACAAGEIRAADGTCACPAGSSKSAGQCLAPPPPPCPAGQAREGDAGACLCPGGKPPDASGACVTCSAAADQTALRQALKDAETRAQRGCRSPGAGRNSGTVTISVAPTGQVSASIEGPLADSEGARCLKSFFEGARIACFSGEPVKLRKNVTLE